MPPRKLAAALAFAGLLTAFHLPAAHAAPPAPTAVTVPQYTLTEIGTLPGDVSAQVQGINQAGEVFGNSSPSSYGNFSAHVFFWSLQGGLVDIGALPFSPPPADQSQAPLSAAAMNDAGQIIGVSEVGVRSSYPYGAINHAFRWTPAADRKSGTIQDLGTLGLSGDAVASLSAVAINSRGQVIGLENPTNYIPEGFLWTPGGKDGVSSNPQMKDLGQMQPALLDDTGRVIGLVNGVVTLYDGKHFVPIGDPAGFDPNGRFEGYRMQFFGTDAQGDIYGNYSTPDYSANPFVWIPDSVQATTGHFVTGGHTSNGAVPPGSPTVAQLPADARIFWSYINFSSVSAFDPQNSTLTSVDLGGLLFDSSREGNPYFPPFDSYPAAINSAKTLVGYCSSSLAQTPIAFLEQAGLMYDLNRHIAGANAGVYNLWVAIGINDTGKIAAFGQTAGDPYGNFHAFVLTPTTPLAAPAPAIQLIQPQPPDAGDPDQTVDIQGSGFQLGAKVTYSGAPLTATVYAETQILAHIPSAKLTAGTHTVTVTNPDGRSASGRYVVLPVRPVPSLVSVSPPSLPAGSPDTALMFTGTGLYPETQVGYGYAPGNDTLLTVLSASADHKKITVLLPAAAMVQGTTLTFYAATPGERGTGGNYPAPVLTVLNPVPAITSISPQSLPADTLSSFLLTVNGTGFTPGTHIMWNGGYVYPTTYVSSTQVTGQISQFNLNVPGPDMVSPGPVTVSVVNGAPGGGTASTYQTFTDGPYPAPTLTSVGPSIVAPGVGAYLTLTGSHFLHHSVIHLGSQAFSVGDLGAYLSDDRTQLSFYLPATAVPTVGVIPVTVVNPGPGGGTSAFRPLTVQGASLRVSSAVLTRDPVTQEIVAQVALTDGYGADATGVTLTQATLAGASASGLPVTVGTVPAGTTTTVTLRFPAAAAAYGTPVILRVSGQYAGGSFLSSRRAVAP